MGTVKPDPVEVMDDGVLAALAAGYRGLLCLIGYTGLWGNSDDDVDVSVRPSVTTS